jgi:hypothetical protein
MGSLQKHPKPCGQYEMWSGLLWDRGQDGLICSSANNVLVAQVCTNPQSPVDEE